MGSIHTVEYYLALNTEILMYVTTQTNPENMLSGRTQL